jgi:hypothetical protein
VRSALLPRGTGDTVARQLTPEPERPVPTDPVEWIRERGGFAWSKQREILRSVVEHHDTYVPSCHSAGKSRVAAEAAAYWIASHPVGEALVVTTAPTDEQVEKVVWKEVGRVKADAGLPGSIAGANWHVGPAGARTLVGFGVKPQKRVNIEQGMQRMQGHHARYLLVIIDEATGVEPWIWDAVDSLASNVNARVLAIGNPDDPSSEFGKRCDASTGSLHKPGERYVTRLGAHVIPIDAYATPNFTGERVPEWLREHLVAREYAETMIARHGEENPLVVSKVRGLFPDRSTYSVISPALIRRAWALVLPGFRRGAYGLDVARSAHGDESALYRDRGGVIRAVDVWREPDTTRTTERVLRHTQTTPEVPIAVDVDGIGGGVFDLLRRGLPDLGMAIGRPRMVVPFSVASPAREPTRFDGRRSEVWWAAREELESGLWDLDPADEDLAAQLTAPRWRVDHRGRIHVESKDELAARGISSPDRADAAIMARFGRSPIDRLREYGNGDQRAPVRRSETADLMGRPM